MKTVPKKPKIKGRKPSKVKSKRPQPKKVATPRVVPRIKPTKKRSPKPTVKKGKVKKGGRKKRAIKRRAAKKVPIKAEEETLPEEIRWLEEDPHDNILSRFILDRKGKQIGESIGVEGNQLIVKDRKKFFSIPLKSVQEKDNELLLKRKVNWAVAEKKGEKWRKHALDVIKPKK